RITSLLRNGIGRPGRVEVKAFWWRRARRLLPALFLVLAAVAAYAAFLAQPSELTGIRTDGIASLFYVSNWKFIADGTSYFQAFRAPSPLAHTWSLAIEEQWYLLWPFAVVALVRLCRPRGDDCADARVGRVRGGVVRSGYRPVARLLRLRHARAGAPGWRDPRRFDDG